MAAPPGILAAQNNLVHETFDFQRNRYQEVVTRARGRIRNNQTQFLNSDYHNVPYFVVQLVTDDEPVCLLMRRNNLYITAIKWNGIIYEFQGFSDFHNSRKLPFNESYPDVHGEVGFTGFEVAVQTLIEQVRSPNSDRRDWQNNVFLVIIHVAEAMRFRFFSCHIDLSQRNLVAPMTIGQWVMLLIHNWSTISKAAARYAGNPGNPNRHEMAFLRGNKQAHHTYPQHLAWILDQPRLCKMLISIPLDYIF